MFQKLKSDQAGHVFTMEQLKWWQETGTSPSNQDSKF